MGAQLFFLCGSSAASALRGGRSH